MLSKAHVFCQSLRDFAITEINAKSSTLHLPSSHHSGLIYQHSSLHKNAQNNLCNNNFTNSSSFPQKNSTITAYCIANLERVFLGAIIPKKTSKSCTDCSVKSSVEICSSVLRGFCITRKSGRMLLIDFVPCDWRFWADPASASPIRKGKGDALASSTASARRKPCAGSSKRCVFLGGGLLCYPLMFLYTYLGKLLYIFIVGPTVLSPCFSVWWRYSPWQVEDHHFVYNK